MANADIKQPMQPAILIIGGTTEGRIAVEVCDEAGKPYFYSTKNASQQIDCVHGKRISGGLDEESMPGFCLRHNIRLIVDAAHPFAENVHKNIGITAQKLQIPVIRFERSFPPHNPLLH
jgi:cobalt-precorrin-5B (C1)-methyltransferase